MKMWKKREERIRDLYEWIQSEHCFRHTNQEIMERYGISENTVRRDLEVLREGRKLISSKEVVVPTGSVREIRLLDDVQQDQRILFAHHTPLPRSPQRARKRHLKKLRESQTSIIASM